ncbi:MAG TPA: aminotransferase class V-fold PLP-dependent enzyme [Phycisphaerales bacterium]|nr:aminotransferase class V-fold PLP-dependent enzyme [Phycisphaerales bacterium]HMP36072.1 aminotransferase class V-fold PLP-dependent enzyme [Phycisphaerales bacterium]
MEPQRTSLPGRRSAEGIRAGAAPEAPTASAVGAAERPSIAGSVDLFPVLAGDAHLNHAGVAPLPAPVAAAMRRVVDAWSTDGPQPWGYVAIDRLRRLAAELLGVASDEVAIVPNTSTGLAIVAAGLALGAGDVVVTTGVEFPANRYAWEHRIQDGLALTIVPPGPDGLFVDDDAVVEAMRRDFPGRRTRLLAISHVQFASGQRHDIARLAAAAHELGGLICLDAIQSIGAIDVRCGAWEVDFAAADGHKWMLGPEGTGILVVRRAHLERLRPPLVGCMSTASPLDYDRYDARLHPSARRYEPGCHSIVGIAGLAAALELLLGERIDRVEPQVLRRAAEIAEALRGAGHRVLSRGHDGDGDRGSGIVAAAPREGGPPEALLARLRSAGIHGVVRRGLLRLSPHFYNTLEQVERVREALARG